MIIEEDLVKLEVDLDALLVDEERDKKRSYYFLLENNTNKKPFRNKYNT